MTSSRKARRGRSDPLPAPHLSEVPTAPSYRASTAEPTLVCDTTPHREKLPKIASASSKLASSGGHASVNHSSRKLWRVASRPARPAHADRRGLFVVLLLHVYFPDIV